MDLEASLVCIYTIQYDQHWIGSYIIYARLVISIWIAKQDSTLKTWNSPIQHRIEYLSAAPNVEHKINLHWQQTSYFSPSSVSYGVSIERYMENIDQVIATLYNNWYVVLGHRSMVSCPNGPTRHAYAWQIGPFWQDTLEMWNISRGYPLSLDWIADSSIWLQIPCDTPTDIEDPGHYYSPLWLSGNSRLYSSVATSYLVTERLRMRT